MPQKVLNGSLRGERYSWRGKGVAETGGFKNKPLIWLDFKLLCIYILWCRHSKGHKKRNFAHMKLWKVVCESCFGGLRAPHGCRADVDILAPHLRTPCLMTSYMHCREFYSFVTKIFFWPSEIDLRNPGRPEIMGHRGKRRNQTGSY